MPPCGAAPCPPPWIAPRRLAFLLSGFFLALAAAFATDNTPRAFRIAAGDVTQTLKQFAAQAQREIMFPAEPLEGIRTPGLEGTFTPRDALDRLLVTTHLVVVEDAKTGALMVTAPP